MKRALKTVAILSLLSGILFPTGAKGQETIPSIKVSAEIREGAVALRWAATNAQAWALLNEYGVKLERETIVRDGSVLETTDVVLLSDTLKPKESEKLKELVNLHPQGAIVAQALFGDDFEITGGENDVAKMIALGQEQQQRYAFSLYAADLCFPVAVEVGWGWSDVSVKSNERYLYRVISLVPDNELIIEDGLIYIDAGKETTFPKALEFHAAFADEHVMLSWNYHTLSTLYNSYTLEKSTDGINFQPISETPITNFSSETAREDAPLIYIDSIANDVTYYYRLAGLTPFGTKGEYSDTLSGKGMTELKVPPFITKAVPDDNGGAQIEWSFSESDERLIESFDIEHSQDNKNFTVLQANIATKERAYYVNDIVASNYYVVTANSLTGKKLRSFSVLVQAVDTIPPAVPTGLTGKIDSLGYVRLSWNANSDADIYGYRLYKGHTVAQELIPLNDIAIQATEYVDSVSLKTLNGNVYYALTALDGRYNQSEPCETLEIEKPSLIPPSQPLIKNIEVENGKNIIYWVGGGEPNLKSFIIYRATNGNDLRIVKMVNVNEENSFEDTDITDKQKYVYHVVAVSKSNILSPPSLEYSVDAVKTDESKSESVSLSLSSQKEGIKIKWSAKGENIISTQLFKKDKNSSFTLFLDGVKSTDEIIDRQFISGMEYQYMLVVKSEGRKPITVVKKIIL